MRGKPGICCLVGLVVDDENTLVKGYLVKAPAAGFLVMAMRKASEAGVSMPWTRRERFCRSIVQAVAESHSCGYTVGSLGHLIDTGVVLDEEENALLFRFQQAYHFEASYTSLIPPKHHALMEGRAQGAIDATPESDILLGLTVWMLAANQDSSTVLHIANAEFRKSLAGEQESFEHLESDVPDYIHSIIYACIPPIPTGGWQLGSYSTCSPRRR